MLAREQRNPRPCPRARARTRPDTTPAFPGPAVERTPAQNPPTGRANSCVVTGVCDCLVLSTFVSVFVITIFNPLPKVAGHVVETMRCRWVATGWGCRDWVRKALAELSVSIAGLRVAPGVDVAVLRSRCFFPLGLCWEAFANKSTVGIGLVPTYVVDWMLLSTLGMIVGVLILPGLFAYRLQRTCDKQRLSLRSCRCNRRTRRLRDEAFHHPHTHYLRAHTPS